MKINVKNIILFFIRGLFLFVLCIAIVSKNIMLGLDTDEISSILNLLNKYKDSFSMPYAQDLVFYNIIYQINKYFIQIVIINIIIWITLEIIIKLHKKEGGINNE